jgi:subtilisin
MSFQLIRSRPAWSSAFTRQRLQPVEPVAPLAGITAEWAWGGSTGRGVKVAIIDSGIDASHPGVGGEVNGYATISDGGDGVRVDTTPHQDEYGHGTACASIIRSLAPECELYSIRVLGPTLGGKASHFEAGLRWAIDNGMHVVNLSLGTTTREYCGILHELSDRAYFQNVALITAANNRSIPTFPSIYSSVISVATHDVADPFCWYYNPRPPVEFGANGTNVRVAWKNGDWITTTGNSYAAAHISGIIALILGKHAGLTNFHLKSILWARAANVGGLPWETAAGQPDEGERPAVNATWNGQELGPDLSPAMRSAVAVEPHHVH